LPRSVAELAVTVVEAPWKEEDSLDAVFQKLIDGFGIYYPKDMEMG